ncbi:MAG: ComF family protein [Mailhella sp.]|nr:ComF family protein [Mailhella sp.]
MPDGNGAGAEERFLCEHCRPLLKRRNGGHCPYCGEIFAFEDAPCVPCASCLQKLPLWADFMFYGVHEGLLRDLIVRAKFGGSLSILNFLGSLLAELCARHYAVSPGPDAVLPLPLHSSRLRARGFSQCAEMARQVARAVDAPLQCGLLEKKCATQPQAGLDREERKKLPQVFRVSGDAGGMHVLIVDDVCTTGTTLARAAECLASAGAARVDVAVLARTPLHGQE